MSLANERYLKKYAEVYTAFTPRKTDVVIQRIMDTLYYNRANRGLLVDIGCGPAEMGFIVRGLGYSYVGVDINPYILNRARRDYPNDMVGLSEGRDLPIATGEASTVLMNMLVHSLASTWQLDMVAEEAYRVLDRDGLLIFIMLAEGKTANLVGKNKKKSVGPVPIKFPAEFPKGRLLMKAWHWPRQTVISELNLCGFYVVPFQLYSALGALPNDGTYELLLGIKELSHQ